MALWGSGVRIPSAPPSLHSRRVVANSSQEGQLSNGFTSFFSANRVSRFRAQFLLPNYFDGVMMKRESRMMFPRIFYCAARIVAGLASFLWLGCSSNPKLADDPSNSKVRYYAHCDTCKWDKGSFKRSQDVQDAVTSHNKEFHDWFKVAYYNQVKGKN